MSLCSNFNGPNAPFCSPTQNQQIPVGRPFEVTWDPTFFNSTEVPFVRVQADFSISASDGVAQGGQDGFTSELIPTSIGRFTWNVLPDYLAQGFISAPARMFLAEPSEINITTRGGRNPGPFIQIVASNNNNAQPPAQGGNRGGNINNGNNNNNNNAATGANPVAIALPIVFGILTLCSLGFCVWFKRRNPDFLRNMFAFRRRRYNPRTERSGGRFGLGLGRSRSQIRGQDIKVVTTDMNGLRMNAMAMNGGQDRNVFREELRRQDRTRF
ncbi:hypothetical protein OQA88_2342 [Cercophora sp. LCS_1]